MCDVIVIMKSFNGYTRTNHSQTVPQCPQWAWQEMTRFRWYEASSAKIEEPVCESRPLNWECLPHPLVPTERTPYNKNSERWHCDGWGGISAGRPTRNDLQLSHCGKPVNRLYRPRLLPRLFIATSLHCAIAVPRGTCTVYLQKEDLCCGAKGSGCNGLWIHSKQKHR